MAHFKYQKRKCDGLPNKVNFNALQGSVPKWPAGHTKPQFQAANKAGQIVNKGHFLRDPLPPGSWDNDKGMRPMGCVAVISRNLGCVSHGHQCGTRCYKASQKKVCITSEPTAHPNSRPNPVTAQMQKHTCESPNPTGFISLLKKNENLQRH